MGDKEKQCYKCGGVMEFKEGIGKTGKPYQMWKCRQCSEVEWVKTFQKPTQPTQLAKADPKLDEILEIVKRIEAEITKEPDFGQL